MNFIENIIPGNLASAFGWMIVHSLWEGALVALLLSIVLLMLNKKSARVRYLVSVGALLFFAAISIRTFVEHYNSTKALGEPAEQTENIEQASFTNNLITNNSETNNNTVTDKSFFEQVSQEYSNYFYQHIPLVVTIYLLGVLFLTLKLTGGFLYTQRLKHHKVVPADSKFELMKNKISDRLNIKQKIKLLESALVSVPVALGYFKPVVLFPIGTLAGLSYVQVEAIIAHELAHIKRADYLVNFFQSIVEVLFFYHPAIWWMSSIIREERENVCDDIALEVSEQPAELARALVYVSQFGTSQPYFAMSAIGNKNKLTRRVKRMMGENNSKTVKSRAYAASLMLLIVMAFGAIACSTANGESYTQSHKNNLVYKEDRYGDSRYINTGRLDDDERSYIFYKRYHGDKIRWEVTVDDDAIVSLYKDDELVSSSDYYMYEDMILDEIEDIDYDLESLDEDLADLKDIKVNFDDDFYEDMARLKDGLKDIKIEIDDDFAEDMREMTENIRVNFDGEKFREEMAKLKEELKGIKVDINWDSDEFRHEMKNLSKELANIKVDIDLSGLHESMRELKEEMKHLDIDMSGLKEEMEKLGDFLRELKDEMISDGVIDYEDDLRNIEFEDDALYVNHKKVPHDLYLKYREIYKKYYDEYPDHNSFRFHDDDRW